VAGVLTTPATVGRYRELGALYLYVGLPSLLGAGTKGFLSAIEG